MINQKFTVKYAFLQQNIQIKWLYILLTETRPSNKSHHAGGLNKTLLPKHRKKTIFISTFQRTQGHCATTINKGLWIQIYNKINVGECNTCHITYWIHTGSVHFFNCLILYIHTNTLLIHSVHPLCSDCVEEKKAERKKGVKPSFQW